MGKTQKPDYGPVEDACRSAAASIITAPMKLADRGGRLPTDQAFVWMVGLAALPVTLPLSVPFWLGAKLARRFESRPGETDEE
jgi:hypothetical protein